MDREQLKRALEYQVGRWFAALYGAPLHPIPLLFRLTGTIHQVQLPRNLLN